MGSCHPNIELHFTIETVLFMVLSCRCRGALWYHILGNIMDLSQLLCPACMRTLFIITIEKYIVSLILKLLEHGQQCLETVFLLEEKE